MNKLERDIIIQQIRDLEAAQDSRAQILGYTLIRMWERTIEPRTKFVNATCKPEAAAMFSDEKLWNMLGSIRHEVGRHARVNAYHQTKIDELRQRLREEVLE